MWFPTKAKKKLWTATSTQGRPIPATPEMLWEVFTPNEWSPPHYNQSYIITILFEMDKKFIESLAFMNHMKHKADNYETASRDLKSA